MQEKVINCYIMPLPWLSYIYWLIHSNIQNKNKEDYFKLCLVRYLHPVNHNPARIKNADKDFAKELDSRDKISSQN